MDKINRETGKKYIPHFIRRESDLDFGSIVTHEDYNARFNLNAIQGDYNTETLRLLLTIANSEDVPHVPYIDGYINEIIDELDTKTKDTDLATVAKSGSYVDLLNTPTKLSEFTNDTKFINEDTLNNNLTNLSEEVTTLFQTMDNRVTNVENTANSAINSATSAQNTAISAEEKANTANTNAATAGSKAEEALTLAQSYGETIANKQDQLTAGVNINIIDNVISATDTTYIAGDNVTIVDNVISSIDTKYTAGADITIDENNVISYTGEGSSYELPIASNTVLGGIKVGANLTITEDGTLNAEAGGGTGGTEYTAGEGIRIEDDIISSKPWFFSFSKGPDDTFTLGSYPEIGAMFVKIANYYLKYKEIPIVYWYDGSLTNGKISFTNTNLHKLQALYFSTSNQLKFVFSTMQNVISSQTGTYGIKGSYMNWISEVIVTFSSSELAAGEIVTIPISASFSGVKPIYVLQEDGLNKILATNNTTSFTPTSKYHPATKKYVDDTVANAKGTEYTAGENISISEDNVISAILKTYENIITEENGATTYVQSDTATTMLQVLDNLENPSKYTKVNSNSLIVCDGDNQITIMPDMNYIHLRDTAYNRTVHNYNADNTLQAIVENLSEETGPEYTLVDKDLNMATLTPTSLTIAGEDVLNRYGNLGINTKGGIGLNASGNTYIRTTLEDGKLYQLVGTPKGIMYQYHDGTNWSTIWGDSSWTNIPLASGVTAGTITGTPKYRKVINKVDIKGSFAFTKGSSATLLGTLPAGFRPPEQFYFFAPMSGTRIARCYITEAGQIYCEWIYNINGGTAYTGSVAWTSFNVSFYVD